MARVLRMPGVASGTDDGVLSSWLVEETERFDAAQTIAYVETSTLLLSVEAGRPGVLLKTLVEPGTQVGVGMPIGVIADHDEQVGDLETLLTELDLHTPAPSPEPAPPEPAPAKVLDPQQEQPEAVAPIPTPTPSHRAARSETSVAVQEPEPHPAPPPGPDRPASRLTHDHLRTTVRAERLVAVAAQAASAAAPVTIEHLVLCAVAGAHRQLPELNLTRGPDGVRREDGVAVALLVGGPDGLVAPVLRDVAGLSLRDLAQQVSDLTGAARAGRGQEDGPPGSVAVSHLGRYGLDDAVPSVVPPQVASLAVGAVRDEPVVQAGAIVAGKTLTLTLSVDHDAVDDVSAARWLGVVAALLERPEWMHD